MACLAEIEGRKVALCFEAKVFESLDKTLKKYRTSNGKIARCDELCNSFFGNDYNPEYEDCFFQILSSVAGTIAFASEKINDGLPKAYFVLYQIIPNY